MIETKDIHWTAGFLEGEGYFGGRTTKKGKKIEIVASQVQKEPLEKLKLLFNGNLMFSKRQTPQNSIWKWYLCGKKAVSLMMTIYLLMSSKRKKQIEKAINHWKSYPARDSGYCKNGHKIEGNNIQNNKHGRQCKICLRENAKRWRIKHPEYQRQRRNKLHIERVGKK